ncbi:hypothetical protein NIES593_10130 [Hydrococcus rivularis NIES-593]|uniref:Uncharacterized protein n=1 Tax=Hydrococcus rivularis NIES-593 TaxID=1921803 RepID=A0A1U7HHZ8_9CYAN|nr:hypothetical protein [Hydrococcus rivularis]OKH23197.1 hypothetical protein NIES593_10130 [Hydrococcus rivularis NIES-593]
MKTVLHNLFLIGILELTLSSPAKSRILSVAQASSTQYTFEDYRKECLQRATREKLPQDVAEDLCNCTINRFRSRYTLEEFRSLVKKSKNNTAAAETLTAVGESCFEEVMYEE